MDTTTITLDAATLERVLANGILFAAQAKDCLPALEVVRFDWDGDTLLAVATNRYVLSYEQVDYHGNGNTEGRDPFSIGVSDAERVIAMLKALRTPNFPVAVKYDGESAKATFMVDGDTMIVSTEHGQFPQWTRLIGHKTAEREAVTFNTKWLGLLAKVKTDYRGDVLAKLEFAATANGGPAAVTIGEHFKAMLMAVTEKS